MAQPSTIDKSVIDKLERTSGSDLAERSSSFSPAIGKFKDLHKALSALEEIADFIREDTGWDCDVSKINFEVVKRNQVAEIITADIASRAGYTIEQWKEFNKTLEAKEGNVIWTKFENWMEERTLRALMGGVYLPSQSKIIFVEENLVNFNEQGIRKVLFHELIHAAQDQQHPGFFHSLGNLFRQALDVRLEHGSKNDRYIDLIDTLNARMSWIEGQPTYLQDAKKNERFPRAKLGISISSAFLSIVSLMNSDMRKKMMQYMNGKTAFQKLYEEGDSRQLVDVVFNNPSYMDLMLKTRGQIVFNLKKNCSSEEIDRVHTAIKLFGNSYRVSRQDLSIIIITDDGSSTKNT